MIHNENNHSAGETKATDDAATATAATATAATATARVCFQQLPRHLRLGIFHCLTYRNYVLVSPTCKTWKKSIIYVDDVCTIVVSHPLVWYSYEYKFGIFLLFRTPW
jgi:hypothetical protein